MSERARICFSCGRPALDSESICPHCTRSHFRTVSESNWMWRRVKWERKHPEDRPAARAPQTEETTT